MSNRRGNCQNIHWGLALLGVMLAAPWTLPAQVTSIIQGHISDPTGASVPGATVRATNQATGVAREATSAEDGYYRIPDLLAGSYDIEAQKAGFKKSVRRGLEVGAQLTVGYNVALEVGAVTETMTVTGEAPLVETQVTRIAETLGEREVKALPMQGRGILTLVNIQPGIVGKSEGFLGGGGCCDVFSNFAAPVISAAGNEVKANFSLDGLSLRYTEGSLWGANFSPNPDAIQEVNVSTHASSAEVGTMSGPQVQLVTKGGTNDWHGTAHYTFNQDELNALPYFFGAPRSEFPNSYSRLFGATVGGPIVKDRLFIFGAYEGLREALNSSTRTWVETQAFRDFIVATRPNSVAAYMLQNYQPLAYATEDLYDAGTPIAGVFGIDGNCSGAGDQDCPDGIPEAGFARVNRVLPRTGNQFNGRVDYSSASGKDRVYGSYWYTKPEWHAMNERDAFYPDQTNRIDYFSAVYTRTLSPNMLNEARFGYTRMNYQKTLPDAATNSPGIANYDSFWLGNFAWSTEDFPTASPEFNDVFTINRGRHGIRIGGGYRYSSIDFGSRLFGDTPQYDFLSVLDFADDEPYLETRALDAETGQAIDSRLFFESRLMNLFVQNTWQVRPNLTFNYGVRWENYFSNRFGNGRSLWTPVITSAQLNSGAVAGIRNQKVDDYYNSDKNNFGPRLGLAWDPSGKGKLALRLGFSVLYDEVNTLPLYTLRENPPLVAYVSAGPQAGINIPIVYGVAPAGTRDFPANPALLASGPTLNEFGAFAGNPTSVGAFVQDLKIPTSYDFLGGVQYELIPNFMVHGSYHYKRTTNELYDVNVNRTAGDMVDGSLDRLNPNFQNITLTTNLGERRYHGLVMGINKRMSQGWQIASSYTYNYGTNNFAFVGGGGEYNSSATEVFNPDLDWGRDDIAHVFSLHNVWELPVLRGRSGVLAGALGGWQLNSVWNLQTGSFFVPVSYSPFGFGGDFNADGQSGDRPDLPPGGYVPGSFSKDQWLAGAMSPNIFERPDTVRPGNMPRDLIRVPGYVRIDVAFGKSFPIPMGRAEKGQLQFRAEAFNFLNRVNLSDVDSNLDSSTFARARGAFRMRVVQLSLKFVF